MLTSEPPGIADCFVTINPAIAVAIDESRHLALLCCVDRAFALCQTEDLVQAGREEFETWGGRGGICFKMKLA